MRIYAIILSVLLLAYVCNATPFLNQGENPLAGIQDAISGALR